MSDPERAVTQPPQRPDQRARHEGHDQQRHQDGSTNDGRVANRFLALGRRLRLDRRIEPRVAMGASGTTQWVGEASGRGFGDRRLHTSGSRRFFLVTTQPGESEM